MLDDDQTLCMRSELNIVWGIVILLFLSVLVTTTMYSASEVLKRVDTVKFLAFYSDTALIRHCALTLVLLM